jgi:hypothetical protein
MITTEELIRKYGSETPVAGLDIYELTSQPDFEPVGFMLAADGKYTPIKSV